ncbi:IS1182 family transposase [Enterococcus sp. DIV0242_7C1]|uniref:Transposase n=1 Tax=Candidatus Enterococcus dunnyi TaxID=1834192 RepID=A0A200J6J0_9ENTE|nr:IS1182 family transposase [Enterococcus sp. DIV0242_7C1]OUZ32833.1 transposase [Enterococcus sp. 9D6_DIV0238]OUZ34912.1 transposase [Enterococcus sp. 9D6_DIV0238]
MMSKHPMNGRDQYMMISLEELVPKDHLIRKIDKAIDFTFIYPIVESTYSTLGRPSIDPVVLVKIVFIQYLFGIRSMRQTIKEIDTNVAYRWFLGYDFNETIPHFSTFGKNYVRRFRETTLFEDIFAYILEQAAKARMITEDVLYMDSTHIKANANKHYFTREMTHIEAKAYQSELEKEINEERIKAGKRPFTFPTESELKERKISKVDPESGYYVKGEREKQFAYSAHTGCDEHGFILDVIVTPGNRHDSQIAPDLVASICTKFPAIHAVAADAGYKTATFIEFLRRRKLHPVLPYTRPRGDRTLLAKNQFVYDEYYDCYLCPENQPLHFSTLTREGYREYKSKSYICQNCPQLKQCTRSQNHQKVVTRHIWQAGLENAEHLRHTSFNRETYRKRKETIERVFADAKEKHGMRWTKYRTLEKVAVHTRLIFAAMNLKKLALWG